MRHGHAREARIIFRIIPSRSESTDICKMISYLPWDPAESEHSDQHLADAGILSSFWDNIKQQKTHLHHPHHLCSSALEFVLEGSFFLRPPSAIMFFIQMINYLLGCDLLKDANILLFPIHCLSKLLLFISSVHSCLASYNTSVITFETIKVK